VLLDHVADIFSSQSDPVVSPVILTIMISLAGFLALCDVALEYTHWRWIASEGGMMRRDERSDEEMRSYQGESGGSGLNGRDERGGGEIHSYHGERR
jgi:hypothetical protein